MIKKLAIQPTYEAISEAVQTFDNILKHYNIDDKDRIHAVLLLEEVLIKLMEAAGENDKITINVNKGINNIKLHASCRGSEVKLDGTLSAEDFDVLQSEYGAEAEGAIRDIVLNSNSERFRFRYRHGVNIVDILVARNKMALMYNTIGAMSLGIAAGVLLRNVGTPDFVSALCTNLFMPLYMIFLTAVQMVMAPLVFFAIAVSLTGFGDLSTLGRIGSKVMGCYTLTTICAIAIGVGMNALLNPGVPGALELPGGMVATSDIHISLLDTIINIVPNNFVGAFVHADMLQVIFLAVIVGIAVGRMGKYAQSTRTLIEQMNDLFGTIISIISRFMPFAIFGSIANTAASLDTKSLSTILIWAVEVLICVALMLAVYCSMLLFMGRVNPATFLRKFMPASLTAFFTSSSNIAIPTSMECCKNLGVAPRVYSFSIPLGATINMDGTSIYFVTATLFLAGLYGIDISGTTLITFIMTVMLLSIATPGVPGAGTACLLMLFSIVGLPAEALALIIGVSPLIELFITFINVTGDGSVTTAVASAEGALDKELFNS